MQIFHTFLLKGQLAQVRRSAGNSCLPDLLKNSSALAGLWRVFVLQASCCRMLPISFRGFLYFVVFFQRAKLAAHAGLLLQKIIIQRPAAF